MAWTYHFPSLFASQVGVAKAYEDTKLGSSYQESHSKVTALPGTGGFRATRSISFPVASHVPVDLLSGDALKRQSLRDSAVKISEARQHSRMIASSSNFIELSAQPDAIMETVRRYEQRR